MLVNIRSFLFVPGDSGKKLAKAEHSGADALILDLEDAVSLEGKSAARELTLAYLRDRPRGARRSQLWVRINALDSGLALTDLAQIVAAAPDGIVLPKAQGPEDVCRLSHYLDALETRDGVAPGSIKIVPIAAETALAAFQLGNYPRAGIARLLGITWGAEDLAAALGASTNLDADGQWALTYRLVRSLTLLAARAAGVQPIDTIHADFRDEPALRAASRASRAEGFGGRLAIHPAQIAAINESYAPSTQEIDRAQRIVAAFDAAPGVGALAIDGKMVDLAHLKQARQVLALAAASSARR